jgi:hypothetical protein
MVNQKTILHQQAGIFRCVKPRDLVKRICCRPQLPILIWPRSDALICRQVRVGQLHGDSKSLQRHGRATFTQLTLTSSDPLEPFTDRLRLALAAYLARFKGSSREHTESDLRCYLAGCTEHDLDPLSARRPHLELHIRWMQEIRRLEPSTVSRRFSLTAGFYRTCALGWPGCRPGACGPRAIRGREADASPGSSSRPGFRQVAGRP